MVDNNWLAERFEAQTTHLRAVAYRMLGSMTEAEDAVQEAWLRLTRSETSAVENLGGWLTTVVARICLDMLRSRKSLPEEPLSSDVPESIASRKEVIQPETEMLVADSVGLALLVVLETLSPAERVAFVLHDMFDLPFDEIAPIVGRSPTAARQLASRARRRVHGASAVSDADFTRQREVVDAFLAASRGGDFGALLAVLDPEVVLRADSAAVQTAAANRGRGARSCRARSAARARWPIRLRGVPGLHNLLWSTEPSEPCGLPVDSRALHSALLSSTGRSSKSKLSRIPRASTSSISRSSATEQPKPSDQANQSAAIKDKWARRGRACKLSQCCLQLNLSSSQRF